MCAHTVSDSYIVWSTVRYTHTQALTETECHINILTALHTDTTEHDDSFSDALLT